MFEAIKKLISGTKNSGPRPVPYRKGESICGIDIGSGSIKVVQVKEEKGKIVLETYGALSLAPFAGEAIGKPARLDTATLAKAVTQALQESRVTAKQFVASFQSNAILVFTLQLPVSTKDKLDSVIPTEARKYIPVPLTEVSLDWFIIPEKDIDDIGVSSSTMSVLVVALRNEVLQNYQDIFTQATIPNPSFEIEIFATMRSVLGREIAPIMIADIGTGYSSVAIVEYGTIRLFHIINRGSSFVTETIMRSTSTSFDKAEELKFNIAKHPEMDKVALTAHQYLISEMKRTLLEYEREHGRTVAKIILTGGGSTVAGFKELVDQEISVEVIMGNPFNKVDAPDFLRPLLITSGPQFSVATGLALKNMLSF